MKHRSFLFPFLIFCLTLLLALPVFANAAEPPCLTIVVVGAPEDLDVSLVDDEGAEDYQLRKRKSVRGWETYFRFTYSHVTLPGMIDALDGFDLAALHLSVTVDGISFVCELPQAVCERYNNVVQLDVGTQTLKTDLYLGRMALIIGLRVVLTLLIEGFLFWAFGYRQSYSWGMFFCLNCLTQLGLNLLIGSASMDSYVLFFYYLLEGVIILFETIAFPLALREKRLRAIPYAILANLASMFIGGLMIANLPLAL